ncbi:MAG: ABC transporter ATP-binding protein [Pseudoxanthomonas sp.]
MSAPLLRVRELRLALPAGAERSHALHALDLELAEGQLLGVVGESGSGKSMLAQALTGLLPAGVQVEQGRIEFAGRELLELDEAQWRRLRGREIGLVLQEAAAALNPVLRIGAQIGEGLRIHRRGDAAQRRRRVLELLDYVDLPDPAAIAHAYPFQLSGGQRQRVLIAQALACAPRLLIADEPTSALDAGTRGHILRLLQRIRRDTGMAVLLISHDLAAVRAHADQVLVLRQGHVLEEGQAAQVLGAPRADYTRQLLTAAQLPARTPRAAQQDAAAPLTAHGLHKRYAGGPPWRRRRVDALVDASLSLRRGEAVGIVGHSGSGKSTLARALVRLLRVDAGELRLHGHDITDLREVRLRPLRRHVQMVFQDPVAALNPRHSIGRALLAGPLAQGVARAEAERRARELLALVGLPDSAFARLPQAFSGGQRQRICIARALAMQPDVLVADECVSALDALIQAQILDLLEQLQDRLGLALVFITHDLRAAARLCDRILVMQHGRIVEQGGTQRLLAAPEHPYTRSLLQADASLRVDDSLPEPGA